MEYGVGAVIHWVIVLLLTAAIYVPMIKIIQKAGYSGWWFLASFIPIFNLVMWWIFAFASWPNARVPQANDR